MYTLPQKKRNFNLPKYIDGVAFVKHGDNTLGSVCPSVCLYACALLFERRVITSARCLCVCVCNQWVCVDNCTDAVHWLLIPGTPGLVTLTPGSCRFCQMVLRVTRSIVEMTFGPEFTDLHSSSKERQPQKSCVSFGEECRM